MYTDVLFKNGKWSGAAKDHIRNKTCMIESVIGRGKARSHCPPFQSAKSFSQRLVSARKAASFQISACRMAYIRLQQSVLGKPCVNRFMLMSFMGWTNLSQVKIYTEQARRKAMAKNGMNLLDDEEQKQAKSCKPYLRNLQIF